MAKLYLIPNVITEEAGAESIAYSVGKTVAAVRIFFVEEPKSARALLKKLNHDFPLAECTFIALNEHTSPKEVQDFMSELGSKDAGIISEAGYPCVADPGANVVRIAHEKGTEVIPLVGASSIVLALAASGLNGQSFAFNGYLPKDKQERLTRIKALEQRSYQDRQTQIFMEAPYRSQNLFEDLLSICRPQTLLCVACDITGPAQMIKTQPVGDWKKNPIKIEKIPTLFLLLYF